jgi:hypothetical protein
MSGRLNVSSLKLLGFLLNFVQRTYIQICRKNLIFVHIRHIYTLFYMEFSILWAQAAFPLE